jgi:hypothetical protein
MVEDRHLDSGPLVCLDVEKFKQLTTLGEYPLEYVLSLNYLRPPPFILPSIVRLRVSGETWKSGILTSS